MTLIKPRLTEAYDIYLPQAEVDFAIPFLEEDLPLYIDPFLLWKSPSHQDKSLHIAILNSFNNLGYLLRKGGSDKAIKQLITASECEEIGLGVSAKKNGKRIGKGQAEEILRLFATIPQYARYGFQHFEEIQCFVDGISKDRISDIACNFMKSFLIDYTIDQCQKLGIPLKTCTVSSIYNISKYDFEENVSVELPINPNNGSPIILVPKRWLRYGQWINFDDYFKAYCPRDNIFNPNEPIERVKVLNYNRENYGVVEAYIKAKELTAQDCKNDPLFSQIPLISAKRKLYEIKKLPTGKLQNADKEYEEAAGQLLASMMYPHMDFADMQSRTDSGLQIRDLIFYNTRSTDFLKELFADYGSKQIVMELKNVAEIDRDHINQLNRYMADELGKFGVLVTRHEVKKSKNQSLIDLWSGQRRSIITLTDADLEQMVQLYESKQRDPIDVLKKKYVEFRRSCPA